MSALADSDAAARAPTQPAVERRADWPGAVYRWALLSAATLALAVVVLGATVRLADAGLSCPDWPGCYGALTVSGALATPPAAREQRWAGQPLDAARARIEMLHRYAAGSLGLCILGIVVLGRRWRPMRSVGPLLVGLVLMQALLGLWTVTSRLEPLVVTAHLLGGMTVLALLWWLTLRARDAGRGSARDGDTARFVGQGARTGIRLLAQTGLLLLVVQIGLGGWVAANHATLACQGFPTCNGSWWPAADVADGYGPLLGRIAEVGMSGPGRIAVHWVHRLGAAGLVLVLGTLALLATRTRQPLPVRRAGAVLFALLLAQVGLGAAIVLAGAPVVLAAAHNAVAALLLILLVTLTWQLRRSPASVNSLSLNRRDDARRKTPIERRGTEG